jgi:predicted nucleic acid-binding protein
LKVYFDASVLIAVITNDLHSARAETFLRATSPVPVVSDFAAAEFTAVVGRRVRNRDLTRREAQHAFANFDRWRQGIGENLDTTAADMRVADAILRRLEHNLRAPDALNIVLAQRVGAMLATFDTGMAKVAGALGVSVAVV